MSASLHDLSHVLLHERSVSSRVLMMGKSEWWNSNDTLDVKWKSFHDPLRPLRGHLPQSGRHSESDALRYDEKWKIVFALRVCKLHVFDYNGNTKFQFHYWIDLASVNNFSVCEGSLPNGGGAERMRGGEGQLTNRIGVCE